MLRIPAESRGSRIAFAMSPRSPETMRRTIMYVGNCGIHFDLCTILRETRPNRQT